MGRLREQHHRGGDDHHDVEKLDLRHLLFREGDDAEQRDEDGAQQEKRAQELAGPGVLEQAVEARGAEVAGREVEQQADEDAELADDGDRGDEGVLLFREDDLEHEKEEREHAERDLGRDGRPGVGFGGGFKLFDGHGWPEREMMRNLLNHRDTEAQSATKAGISPNRDWQISPCLRVSVVNHFW